MRFIIILLFAFMVSSCDSAKQLIDSTLGGTSTYKPSNSEVISGLKEALKRGTTSGSDVLAKVNGYFENPSVKIFFPDELKNAESKLRDIGLGSLADNIILSFNRAAESAASEAKPIFINAITQMTVGDAMNILLGPDDAATQYLKKTTSDKLYSKFKPVIDNHLNKVGATKYWSEAVTKYNSIPFTNNKLPKDVSDYVANEAMDGLFFMIEKEEARIRQDPLTRTTQILKKVFGYADEQKG
ncbi:MAG: DUF4197 domain-containing protein [Bacteroidia bacterium]|nr:DUF4197 domain-containing protein [Bacteroidia bacterium]